MNYISFESALSLLDNYLLADSMILCSPEIRPDKKAMAVKINNYKCHFEEFNNPSVKISDNTIYLVDSDGDEWSFQVLSVAALDLTNIPVFTR